MHAERTDGEKERWRDREKEKANGEVMKQHNGKRRSGRQLGSLRRRALTLIELIVVITILGILATLIVSSSVGRIGEANQKVAVANIKVLESKVLEFYADCGRLPNAQEGLQALVRRPSDSGEKWKGPYVKEKEILDPWGAEYLYRSPGQHNNDFDIATFGADKQEGGEGENADVGNW